jgi:hypothetical protein
LNKGTDESNANKLGSGTQAQTATGTATGTGGAAVKPARKSGPSPKPVVISDEERTFMQELYPLIQTPGRRSASSTFIASPVPFDPTRAAHCSNSIIMLVLLALTMSSPRLGSQFFPELDRRGRNTKWIW